MSGVIRSILKGDGRFAIIGVPCFLRAVRKAQQKIPALGLRTPYLIGLACNLELGKRYVEFIRKKMNLKDSIQQIKFRKKMPGGSPYYFEVLTSGGERVTVRAHEKGLISLAFFTPFFSNKACEFCDDHFAEEADVVLMDAWLPQYSQDWRGTNFLIVRNSEIEKVLKAGADQGDLFIKTVTVEDIIKSQRAPVYRKKTRAAQQKWLLERRDKNAAFIRLPSQKPSLATEISIIAEDFWRKLSEAECNKTFLIRIYFLTKKIATLFRNYFRPFLG